MKNIVPKSCLRSAPLETYLTRTDLNFWKVHAFFFICPFAISPLTVEKALDSDPKNIAFCISPVPPWLNIILYFVFYLRIFCLSFICSIPSGDSFSVYIWPLHLVVLICFLLH
jgi:hypothetical protein